MDNYLVYLIGFCVVPIILAIFWAWKATQWRIEEDRQAAVDECMRNSKELVERTKKDYDERIKNLVLHHNSAMQELLAKHEQLDKSYTQSLVKSFYYFQRCWLDELKTNIYRNEIEVEVKVVYPLLKCLNYSAGYMSLRQQVTVQVGRQELRIEPDWVISGSKQKPWFVIEAKAPNQPLDDTVQKQARSYAFGLNCRLYVLTNGRELRIYRRDIEHDTLLYKSTVLEIEQRWTDIASILGRATLAKVMDGAE